MLMKTPDAVRLLCGCCLISSLTLQPAFAQGAAAEPPARDASSGMLQEVIVTAQKREESLQETPIAISAMTAEVLEQRGIVDVSQLTALSPNLTTTISPGSMANSTISLRGVANGDGILTSDSPVGTYVDGVVLGRQAGAAFDLVDLERVEVLRGPQGTLYGRNTIGGAVNLITAKPADEFRLKGKLSYGRWNRWQARTSLDTGEWGESGIRAKLSYVHKEQDGYVDNLLAPDKSDPGASELDGARVALSFDRGGAFRASYAFDYNKVSGVPAPFQVEVVSAGMARVLAASPALGGRAGQVSPTRLDKLYLDHDEVNTDEIKGHTLTLDFDVGANTTLRSLTGYREFKQVAGFGEFDGQGGILALTLDPRVLAPPPYFAVIPTGVQAIDGFFRPGVGRRRQHQLSQEFNLLGKVGERLAYVAGVFYFDESSYEWSPEFVAIPLPEQLVGYLPPSLAATVIPIPPSLLSYTHESESKAVFGQATYDLTDRLSFTGGVRYTEDQKDLDQVPRGMLPARKLSRDFSRFNWAVALDLKLNDQLMTYGRVATGYKAGGIMARSANDGYDPEDLTSYELGVKSTLLDRRLRLNAAVFYVDHEDMQLGQLAANTNGSMSNTVNAGQAEYKGLEVEFEALLSESLTLSGGFGYLDQEFKEFWMLNVATNQLDDISQTARFPYSAKTTASAALQYDLPRFPIGLVSARIEYNYRSKVYFYPATGAYYGTPFSEQIAGAGRSLFDARLTLSELTIGGAEASLSLWGKNLTDEEYRVHAADMGPTLGYAGNTWAEPRSYGIDLSVSF